MRRTGSLTSRPYLRRTRGRKLFQVRDPARLALLDERPHALGRLVRREELRALLRGPAAAFFERQRGHVAHELLRLADGVRTAERDEPDQILDGAVELRGGHRPVHEPELDGTRGGEA